MYILLYGNILNIRDSIVDLGHFGVIENEIVKHLLESYLRHVRIHVVRVDGYLFARVSEDIYVLTQFRVFLQVVEEIIVLAEKFDNYRWQK